MFFIHKYAPKGIGDMFFHENILRQLEIIAKKDNLPHMLFYGPKESGKKVLIQRFLETIFDKSVQNLHTSEFQVVSTGTSSKTIVQLNQSNHHIIIEPNNNNFDKHIIHDVVKAYARTIPLSVFTSKKKFKVVLINNADKLSLHAQTALRRTMELYSNTCKFILWCNKISSIIEPIKSRCNPIRVPSPTDGELLSRLIDITKKENMKVTLDEYTKILKIANGRTKVALWLLEFKKLGITDSSTTYDIIIKKIVDYLFVPNIKKIPIIRNLIYNIIITNISGTQIIMSILDDIIYNRKMDNDKIKKIIDIGCDYEHRLLLARRAIIHLESFIINIFSIIHKGNLNIPLVTKKKSKKKTKPVSKKMKKKTVEV
jgi:replication factor C subunit 3/5